MLEEFLDSLLEGESFDLSMGVPCALALRLELRFNPERFWKRQTAKILKQLEQSPEWHVRAITQLLSAEMALATKKVSLAKTLVARLKDEAEKAGARLYTLEAELLLARAAGSEEKLLAACRNAETLGYFAFSQRSCGDVSP
jgi:hypothetical protein